MKHLSINIALAFLSTVLQPSTAALTYQGFTSRTLRSQSSKSSKAGAKSSKPRESISHTTNDTTLNLTKTNTLEAEDIFSMMEEAGHISSKGSKSSGLQFRNETGTGKSSKSQFKFSEPQFRNETSKSSKSQFRLRNQTDIDTIISSGNRTSRGRESEPNFLFPAKAAKFLKAQNMFLNTTATNSSRSSRSNNDNADVTADSVVSANSGSTSAASCAWIGTAAVTGLIHILYQIV